MYADSPLHYVFPIFPSTHRTNFLFGIIVTKIIKLSNGVLRSGDGGVAAKLCLKEPIWQALPTEGVTQWWGPLKESYLKAKVACKPFKALFCSHCTVS